MKSTLSHLLLFVLVMLIGCTNTKKAIKSSKIVTAKAQNTFQDIVQTTIFSDSNFAAAHVGISIYNPATQQYLYNYQGDKYFVPASNMKLFTCYAAMKNLGDSLVGLRYFNSNGDLEIQATGDPTFLHSDFKNQPVLDFLKVKPTFSLVANNWSDEPLGSGWAWNDYNGYYMAERSPFPIYGNTVKFQINKEQNTIEATPTYFNALLKSKQIINQNYLLDIKRDYGSNDFKIVPSKSRYKMTEVPFITDNYSTVLKLLVDTLKPKLPLRVLTKTPFPLKASIIYSQPTDSLLKPMMHNSDNFFAEQTLLMVSNEKLGVMSDEHIIDTLLKTDFKGLPQKPHWVDGSGLSRYNLVTPQDFVWVLNKMKSDFPWQRITTILATGNEGTLANYYKNLSGSIFAKTGTLSGQVALSGYLLTKQDKTLVFSILVNNHQASATAIRRGVEQFLTKVYEQY